MENEYAQAYAQLYRQHWWWRAREEFLLNLFRQLELPAKPSILDVGCGDGLFFEHLLGLGGTVAGLESEPALVSPATRERFPIHLGPFDATFLPDSRYSLVLMLDVLEHLPDPLAALQHAATLLRPAGYLVITVPAFLGLWTTHDDLNHHRTRFTKSSLAALLQQTSLQIERQRYFFHWLAMIKLLVRCKEKCLPTKPALPRVPTPFVNHALLTLARWEGRLLARTALPFGSSLLTVCRNQQSAACSLAGEPS